MEAEALCFSVYGASSEVLFPFPGESVLAASCVAWAGCRAEGAARSRLRLKTCDSMTVFHGSVCLLLLMCAPYWRPVVFMQRKGLPCLGQSFFVAQDERMPGGSLSRP